MARGAASQPTGVSLKFKEPISWKAGKPIPVPQLVKRLKSLHSELRSLVEEPEVDLPSIDPVAKDLAATALLHHKDETIRAFLACCLADILYLYAPDAPYTANQLREIFDLFIKTMKGLEDADSVYYQEHLYLLDRLHETQSIVLITDLPGADTLITNLFTTFFDLSANEGEKNVEYKMTDLLEQVVEEVNTLPTEVIDVLLAQMMRASPTTDSGGKKKGLGAGDKKGKGEQTTLLGARQYPPAYNMAKTICANCVDKMSRHICQYFTDVIMDASPASRRGESPDGDQGETLNDDLKEIEKAHNLMLELYLAVPEVLSNVLPLLETEMASDTADLRVQATGTVGMMATSGSLPHSYPQTWKTWLGRANDKSVAVRVHWVEAAVEILKARTDVTAVLQREIKIKLFDTDERVRVAAVKKIGEMEWESATSKLVSKDFEDNLLETLAQRTKDKKFAVREAAINVLSQFWSDAYSQISMNNKVVIRDLEFIPSSLFDVIYVNDKETNVLLDRAIYESLLPIGDYSGKKDSKTKKTKGKESQAATQAASQAPASQAQSQAEAPEAEMSEDEIRTRRIMILLRCMTDSTEKLDGYNDLNTQEEADLEGKTAKEILHDRERKSAQQLERKEAKKKLNARARKAFFTIPKNQQTYAKALDTFIESCEAFNGGVISSGESDIRRKLDNTIAYLSKLLPDPSRASTDLHNFAKMHDRRLYDQIRRCYSPDSDYETVANSIYEAKKRISNNTTFGSAATTALGETITPLLYRASLLIYNKSHIAHMIRFSTDEDPAFGTSLNLVAHEVLREMSQSNPGVFGAHIKTLCDLIVDRAPSAPRKGGRANARAYEETDLEGLNMEDTIKACSGFAKQYPKELPHDKKLMEALVNFSLYGNSHIAAKHAVAIIMRTSSRKDMYAADLIKKILKEWEYGSEFYLSRLATLSQVVLFASAQAESEQESMNRIMDIAIKEVLLRTREDDDAVVDDDEDEDDDSDKPLVPSELCQAKLLAIKILVNRLRAHGADEDAEGDNTRKVLAEPVYKLLNALIANNGELSKKRDTAKDDRKILYWAAANAFLKLARIRGYEILISPSVYNRLALTAQYSVQTVRKRFVDKVKKHLAASTLPARYYTALFLLAEEKNRDIKEEAASWLKARAKQHREIKNTIMETTFARLLSLLAHHPDFDSNDEDVLKQFAVYILFYLECVVVEENLSLVFYVAQRMKSVVDGIVPDHSESLYTLSDLAQVVIRKYEDAKGWALQTWPGTLRLPAGLFKGFKDNASSNEVARKHYLPEGLEDSLDSIFKKPSRKRKSDVFGAATPAKKRSRTSTTTPGTAKKAKSAKASTSKKKKKRADLDDMSTPSERRRSGRVTTVVAKYADSGSEEIDEDDEEEEEEEGEEEESEDEKMEWEKSTGNNNANDDEDEEESEPEPPKKSNGVGKAKSRSTPRSTSKAATKPKPQEDSDMDEDNDEEEEEEQEEEDEDEDEEESEEEEKKPTPPPTRRGGRKAAPAAAPPKKTPAKKESTATPKAASPAAARGTRASARTRGKPNGKTVISQRDVEDDDE